MRMRKTLNYIAATVVGIGLCLLSCSSAALGVPLEILNDKQLFIDDYMVESSTGVALTMNPAQRAEQVIVQTDPWEAAGLGYCDYLKDGDTFKMWYIGWEYDPNITGNWMSRILYAESQDGINWTKPDLGQWEFQGSTQNNIIPVGYLSYAHGQDVFIDPNASSPAERYKMIFGNYYRVGPPGAPRSRVSGAVSPDGINWTSVDTPWGTIMDWGTDTQNVCFYDPNIEKYVAYVRKNVYIDGIATRRVARSESANFTSFPSPTEVLAADSLDPGGIMGSGIYNSCAVLYPEAPGVYLYFPSIINHDTALVSIQLGISRDGVNIERPFRDEYVEIPEDAPVEGDQIGYTGYMGPGMIRMGDELWMYATESEVPHDSSWYGTNVGGAVTRMVQRLDGFISLDAASAPGAVTTRPFILRGKTLEVNANAEGVLGVEVLDASGQVLTASQPLTADGVALRPTWTDRADLQDFIGEEVRLRFTMQDAKLYAFQVPDASFIAPPLPVKDSADFDYKYEMDALPTAVDVDGQDGVDWNRRRFNGGTATATVAGGALTFTSSTDNPAHYFTADEQGSSYISPGVVGIWPGKTNPADGWTIEISVKVISDLGNYGALALGGSGDTDTAQNAVLIVRAAGQYWGRGIGEEPYDLIGSELDNTDDFHVFRIVQDPNPGDEGETTWRVWRDNVLIGESLQSGDYNNVVERAFFGHGSAAWAGTVEIDYFRFTPGAFAPEANTPGDANGDGKVDGVDAAILAANWLKQSDAHWYEGDFNDDGKVDDADAVLLATNWHSGVTTSRAQVPEPTCWVLLVGILLLPFWVKPDEPR